MVIYIPAIIVQVHNITEHDTILQEYWITKKRKSMICNIKKLKQKLTSNKMRILRADQGGWKKRGSRQTTANPRIRYTLWSTTEGHHGPNSWIWTWKSRVVRK